MTLQAADERFSLSSGERAGVRASVIPFCWLPMIPGMWSGWLLEIIGYQHFFLWVILATIPSFLVVLLIPLEKEFGKKA